MGEVRNICLMGHGSDGKTSLAESMLFLTKGTDRLGKVSDGNTVCDFDPEEIRRQISISTAIAPVEYNGSKINLLDTPGYFDFIGEVIQSERVADAGLIVLTAKTGIGVGTEKAWKMVYNIPRAFYIGKLDEENSDFYKVYDSMREKFGISVCPLFIPIIENEKHTAVVDIVHRKAYAVNDGKEIPIPEGFNDTIEHYMDILSENVAETSETLMEKFFSGEPFSKEELFQGIREGIKTRSLAPVFCGCAYTGAGTIPLIQAFIDYFPKPTDRACEHGTADGSAVDVPYDPNAPACALVFKTLSDQYGKFSFFKVVSGKVTSDMTLINARTGASEKIGHLYIVRGKKHIDVSEVNCGDIGAVSKLADTRTGDTLCANSRVIQLDPFQFPRPCYSLAMYPKVKGGEEKIAHGLNRLSEEDPTFTFIANAETHQLVVSGAGDIHIDVLCSKLKNKFGVEVQTDSPRVPYREKIRSKVTVEGKHKKQSGGHGQYGHVKIEFEPGETEDLEFSERIFGGSVPKNFHPAVEKGLRERIQRGVLAGYPVVFLKATLVDGSYHDVDSSEMAFKLAAGIAYKEGLPKAKPVLLEPVGNLKVTVPDTYMGDVIGDLNKRRGHVMGMTPGDDGMQIVEANVPMAEMHSYMIDLRSMTQGRGSFELDFDRYEEAPPMVQQKVIEETKQWMEDEAE